MGPEFQSLSHVERECVCVSVCVSCVWVCFRIPAPSIIPGCEKTEAVSLFRYLFCSYIILFLSVNMVSGGEVGVAGWG